MYSIPQVAKILKMYRTRVYRLVKAGRIKAEEFVGGKRTEYRISEESLQEFIESHDSTPGRRVEVKQVETEKEEEPREPAASEPDEALSNPEV